MGSEKTQLVLFSEDVSECMLVEQEKRGGVHTAEQFAEKNPEKMTLIQYWVLGGLSQRQIAETLHVSRNVVSLVAQRMMDQDLSAMKEVVGKKLRNLALIGTEELTRRVQHCPELMGTKDLAVMVGVAVQNSQLLSGQATQIHEWDRKEEVKPCEDDYERMLMEEQKRKAIDVDVSVSGDSGGKDGEDGPISVE